MKPTKKSIAIVGGGAAALFFASAIDTSKYDVTIFEKNKSLGRKFLVAGDGGFNLTHSEDILKLIERYAPSSFLENALSQFDNCHFQTWLKEIGIPTFVGSSRRVFPERGIKPIEVLNAILNKLFINNIQIKCEHTWKGWNNGNLLFNTDSEVKVDIVVFAIGGASWKVTGSDGLWLSSFDARSIKTQPFQSSNCAFNVDWNDDFISLAHGEALKNIAVSCGGKLQKGELVITKSGLEGNAIYALSPEIRDELSKKKEAIVYLDLKPNVTSEELNYKIKHSTKNKTRILRDKINLTKIQVTLLKSLLTKDEFMNNEILLARIKKLPIKIIASGPIDKAISTVGGVDLLELTACFELKKLPNHYCIGEMSNWDAPTGGYLIQACFSSGMYLAHYLSAKTIF